MTPYTMERSLNAFWNFPFELLFSPPLSDFLLLVMKDLLVQRSDLKIVLMSATLNAHLFSDYFYNCPCIHVPGHSPSPTYVHTFDTRAPPHLVSHCRPNLSS